MRLHLPKALLAAVLAACLAWPAGAEGEDTPTPKTVTVTQQSDLTTNYTKSSAVSGLTSSVDLLIFNTSAGLYLPRYESENDKTVNMPMSIRIDQNLTIDKGFGGTTYNFSGAISCAETVTSTMIPDVTNQVYNFSGSLENFKGTLSLNSNITANFNNVGTVGAKSISLAGPTTIAETFSSSGNLTSTGTLTNNGNLTVGGSYTGGTITQGDGASLTLASGSVVNVGGMTFSESIGDGSTAARVDSESGFQTYSGSYTLATGGTITNQGATFKIAGETFTGGSFSGNAYTVTETRYNIAEGATKTMSDVQQAATGQNLSSYYINILGSLTGVTKDNLTQGIRGTGSIQVDDSASLSYEKLNDKGAEFTGSINVLGSLTGVSDSTLRHTIDGNGEIQVDAGDTLSYSMFTAKKASTFTGSINVLGTLTGIGGNTTSYAIIKGNGLVQVSGELQYHEGTFLDNFTGTLEIGIGGFLKLGNKTNKLGSLTAIKVTGGGQIGGWGTAKPSGITVELAGGTLTSAGGNLTYSGRVKVTADSTFEPETGKSLTISGFVDAQGGVITTNGSVKHTGEWDMSGQSNTYTSSLKVASGTFESAGWLWGTSNSTQILIEEGANFKKGNFTFAGKSGADSSITFGATGLLGVDGGHTVANTAVTYAGSADATDATILGMNLGNGSTLTVTSGKLQVSGTNTLARMDINGGETTISGSTEVTGTVSVANSSQVILTSGANLTNSGFTFAGQSGDTSSTITFGATGAFAVSDAHTVANTSVTYAGSADATDATVLGMNLGNGSTLTVTSGKLQVSGTNTLARIALNGGETTLTGATAVTGIKGDGIIATSDTIKLTVSDTGTLTHDGFQYTGTELSGLKNGLSMWNGDEYRNTTYNVLVSGGSITQTADDKGIYAKLNDVKLINDSGKTSTLGVDAELSGANIGGTLSINEKTTTTIKNTATGSTTSTIATLTGSGTLKTTGGKTEVTNASGFSGTLAATGGNIELQTAAALTLSEVVVSGGSSISGATSYTADKVSIGAGAAGSLVGSLSINTNGTITLDASAGATTETGGTKGLSLSALTTTFADGGTTTTTGSLTLGSGLTLNLLNLDLKQGQSLTLFSGVTSVKGLSDGNLAKLTAGTLAAEDVFSGVGTGDFNLSYSNNIVALVAQRDVPEPTTATLSLLALMGLAARRRRRKA